jgi:aryl-alcohol dehydrogenase-like predicted oxidoreductase
MDSGKNWLTPADSGVVALPGDGVLACREEVENRSSDVIKCDLSQKDIDLSLEDIKESLKLTDPNKVNVYYLAWSFGSSLDETLLEKWLSETDKLVESGKIEWKTLPEMYNAYINR